MTMATDRLMLGDPRHRHRLLARASSALLLLADPSVSSFSAHVTVLFRLFPHCEANYRAAKLFGRRTRREPRTEVAYQRN